MSELRSEKKSEVPVSPTFQSHQKRLRVIHFGVGDLVMAAALIVFVSSISSFILNCLKSPSAPLSSAPSTSWTVAAVKGEVRRRSQSGYLWTDLNQTSLIYPNDVIYVGEESELKVNAPTETNHDQNLEFGRATLAILQTAPAGGLSVDLQSGDLLATLPARSTLAFSALGPVTATSAGSFHATAGPTGPKIEILNGQFEIAGQTSSSPAKANSTVELVAPAPDSSAWFTPGAAITFQWTSKDPGPFNFEIARDQAFKNVIFAETVSGLRKDISPAQRPTGPLYWRVWPKADTSAQPRASRAVSIYNDEMPVPKSPVDSAELAYQAKGGEKGLIAVLTWEDQNGSTAYDVEVASDEKFTKVVYTKSVTESSESTPPLATGFYYWRVLGKHPDRAHPLWSRTSTFSVVSNDKLPLAPKMAALDLTYVLPSRALDRMRPDKSAPHVKTSSLVNFSKTPVPAFRWAPVSSATSYELEVDTASDFSHSLKQNVGAVTSFTPLQLHGGTLYGRVRGVDKKGLVGPASETTRLGVFVPAPSLDTIKSVKELFVRKDEYDQARHTFKLTWSPRPYADSYEVEWGADHDFKRSRRYKVEIPARAFSVSIAMDYFARVRALDETGSAMSAWSETRKITYTKDLLGGRRVGSSKVTPKPAAGSRTPASLPALGLPKPLAVEPLAETSLTVSENNATPIKFQWKRGAVTEEHKYQLQLSDDPDFGTLITDVYCEKHDVVVNKLLPEGRIYWRVRTVTKKGAGPWSDAAPVHVLYD